MAEHPEIGSIRPAPSDDEVAAIVAALESVWPAAGAGPAGADDGQPTRWRFSGRWWTKPVTLRRDRPW